MKPTLDERARTARDEFYNDYANKSFAMAEAMTWMYRAGYRQAVEDAAKVAENQRKNYFSQLEGMKED